MTFFEQEQLTSNICSNWATTSLRWKGPRPACDVKNTKAENVNPHEFSDKASNVAAENLQFVSDAAIAYYVPSQAGQLRALVQFHISGAQGTWGLVC